MKASQGSLGGSKVAQTRSTDAPPGADQDLGWAAGFADGESCIHITRAANRGRPSYRLGVSVAQNNLEVLEHFRRTVGVRSGLYKTKRQANHKRQCYTLNYTGRYASEAIEKLLPHFVGKRNQALTALRFWVEGQFGAHRRGRRVDDAVQEIRHRYYLELRAMK
ncbi:MAG TPA: LAGLIDADG family homing endonuclease [Methylibium sp.]|uniref:LAGLIDADG family homing endonuclease n=1 Tax=Methylibium sp. TaxID=2067992 RepID=UPI002DB72F87|nr:LAGLIDADG family homing endonuclease [Methylibium sp.]HEU4460880.1 LAGLIDADG family homing endonuclease [Methylibium sp.]